MNSGMDVKPPKVVIDTNVFVSGIEFGGKPYQVLGHVYQEKVKLIVSSPLLSELSEVLRKKFAYPPERIAQITKQLQEFAKLVHPASSIDVCRDPADNRVLEAALTGDCDYIVTGDPDLLDLKTYQNIQIVTPAQFLVQFRS